MTRLRARGSRLSQAQPRVAAPLSASPSRTSRGLGTRRARSAARSRAALCVRE